MVQTAASTVNDQGIFPHGGWDTHHHIFEPDLFPYSAERHLTPAPAPCTAFQDFRSGLGFTHSLLTHGLSYGHDCESLKSFIPRLGCQTTRGIGAIVPETTTDEEMLSMSEAGVRGLRVDLYRSRAMEDVELQKNALLAHARRIKAASLPWSLTMTTIRTEFWDELEPFVRDSLVKRGIPLITDHYALLKAASMLPLKHRSEPQSQPGFQAVMRLVRDGHLWVKLSAPYRISEQSPHFSDVKLLVRAFIGANKHRVLWGSDWPHTPRMRVRTREEAMEVAPNVDFDDKAWLHTLKTWMSDEEWHLMMVENPTVLFD